MQAASTMYKSMAIFTVRKWLRTNIMDAELLDIMCLEISLPKNILMFLIYVYVKYII